MGQNLDHQTSKPPTRGNHFSACEKAFCKRKPQTKELPSTKLQKRAILKKAAQESYPQNRSQHKEPPSKTVTTRFCFSPFFSSPRVFLFVCFFPSSHPLRWGAVGGIGMRWKAFASEDFLNDVPDALLTIAECGKARSRISRRLRGRPPK